MKVLASLLMLVAANKVRYAFGDAALEKKEMTSWPHTYQNCVAGTCRGADQIKSNQPCVEGLYHEGGQVYKKFGANLKVTLYLRGRCEQYHEYVHVLECTKADEWVEATLKYPVQSYKVESCV